MMNNDEIVSDIIALIHSTTQSNYVICSRLSSKLFAYLAQTQLNEDSWKEFNQAIERFDQSIDHPDLQLFRQLIQAISTCSNDCEERNYTLGRDQNVLMDSIKQLRDLLKSHVDLNCFLLVKLIEQQEIRLQLIDLMNLTGMNVGDYIHGLLFDIVHLLCQIDPTFANSIIDHPIVLNAIRVIQNKSLSTVIFALNLLTKLVLTNESFPIQTNSQLTNHEFLKCIFELIETNSQNEELISISIKFFLSLNLRYDYPNENPVILTLVEIIEQISSREFIERLILLFNRNIDPTENPSNNSLVKFFTDLFSEHGSKFFSESNRRLIVEIISRELTDRSCADEMSTPYLSLLELILRNEVVTSETCTRFNELKLCFQTYLDSENCSEENLYIINEIVRRHSELNF